MHKLINDLKLVGYISVLSYIEYNLDLHISWKKQRLDYIYFFSRMEVEELHFNFQNCGNLTN